MLRLLQLHEKQAMYAGFGITIAVGLFFVSASTWNSVLGATLAHLDRPAALLALQMAVVLAVAKIFSKALRAMGQPGVMGEILAGIAMGPSLLALIFPSVSEFLFPATSLGLLDVVSQLGLMLFMFAVGIELEKEEMRSSMKGAFAVGIGASLVPFAGGSALGFFVHEAMATSVPLVPFILFFGISMSITAFPVLARIVHEKGLTHRREGVLALSSAALVDIGAWSALAAILTFIQAEAQNGYITVLLAILYVFTMVLIVRPLLRRTLPKFVTDVKVSGTAITIILCTLLLSSLVTELIGIHALFGAFLAGFIMPTENGVRTMIRKRILDMSLLLLPLFFVSTGLKTNVGLLNDAFAWFLCIVVIATAVITKVFGASLAARWAGYTWPEAWSVGALMNTRGLMELVVLNIGYQLGVLSPTLFTMLVIMALVTTFMTGPLLSFIRARTT